MLIIILHCCRTSRCVFMFPANTFKHFTVVVPSMFYKVQIVFFNYARKWGDESKGVFKAKISASVSVHLYLCNLWMLRENYANVDNRKNSLQNFATWFWWKHKWAIEWRLPTSNSLSSGQKNKIQWTFIRMNPRVLHSIPSQQLMMSLLTKVTNFFISSCVVEVFWLCQKGEYRMPITLYFPLPRKISYVLWYKLVLKYPPFGIKKKNAFCNLHGLFRKIWSKPV